LGNFLDMHLKVLRQHVNGHIKMPLKMLF